MITRSFELNAETGAHVDVYLLSPTQRQQGGRGAVLVCPGGAYLDTVDHEAEPVALRFNALGLHAAVVRYSCGRDARWPEPLLELAKVVALFRENAEAWRVDPSRIAICGFSAGGHLCAMMSTDYAEAARALGLPVEAVRPDCAILAYPVTDLNIPLPPCPLDAPLPENPAFRMADGKLVLDFQSAMCQALLGKEATNPAALDALSPALRVNSATVPSFVWATANDGLVPASHSLSYAQALWRAGVPCELHLFADGPHGLSLADETVAEGPEDVDPVVAKWFDLATAWLRKRGILETLA